MIAHLVLFTPKPDLSADQMRSFARVMTGAFRSIHHIERVIVGRSIDVDPGYQRSMGDMTYEFAAVLEFKDRQALLEYLRHPVHEQLGLLFWESCERTVVSEVEFMDGRDQDVVKFLVP